MSSAPQPAVIAGDLAKLQRSTRRLKITFAIAAIIFSLCIGALVFLGRRKSQELGKANEDLQFDQFIAGNNADTDFVQPSVNTIQFMHRGYSIVFDSVQYTQNGLALSGRLGNPTQLWISSLALNFAARPYPYKIRDKWTKAKFPFWDSEWNIGTAETTVGALNPGATAPFNVTIPNVKQTSDTLEIAVRFSGERYSYTP
ncbi:MAG TPA: hypothetical protein VFA76_06625 [Terriglobales bacterium]|nr:hypothetical protein [Terriglobales bacterium]